MPAVYSKLKLERLSSVIAYRSSKPSITFIVLPRRREETLESQISLAV